MLKVPKKYSTIRKYVNWENKSIKEPTWTSLILRFSTMDLFQSNEGEQTACLYCQISGPGITFNLIMYFNSKS